MKNNDETIKSEIGTEAAWRGFSTQTLYIAKRLLEAENNVQLYPEHIEDLMIMENKKVIELVQVKNLSTDLSLSDLSPKKTDSFFRRCLAYKDYDICLKIVSFGNIGLEFRKMLQTKNRRKSSVFDKLLSYGYEDSDVLWLLEHLEIEKVDELEVENSIKDELKKYIEVIAAYNLVNDSLIYYIYKLSREKGYTSKKLWEERISNIVKNIMAIDSVKKQYQKTIIPLCDYKSNKTREELFSAYRMGVNAHPDHIRNNCDLWRERWIKEIDRRFIKNNIVLIKGASGQGKSTLAYRYLIDTYPELNVMCIQKLLSEGQAIDILSILRGLNDRKDIVIYMDVEPYDIQWLWLCEKAMEFGIDIKILVSIREEDFQRSPIDYSKHNFEEISLNFSKDEAKEIYNMYSNSTYLSFDDAWKSFGEKGPLMEYIFMLNESKTLVARINAQIENIVNHEVQADAWLECLAIISLGGIHNNSISVNSLFQKVECKQKNKMIKHFEKEYFIKITQNNTYIECLHVLRARIIYNLLMERGMFDKENILMKTLGVIEHNATQMLIEYVYGTRITEDFINKIANIEYLSIEIYADIVKALLWCEIHYYYQINKKVIEEGGLLFNNQFMFLGNTDITGLLEIDTLQDICKMFNNVKPDFEEQMRNQLNRLPMLKLDYRFLDCFFELTNKTISNLYEINEENLTAWGYVLFWMSYRNFILEQISEPDVDWKLNIEETLNYILGISKQGWFDMRDSIVEVIMPSILLENGVIYYEIKNSEVSAIINVLLGNDQEQPHSRIMKLISIFQRSFPEKKKYNVKIVGYNCLEKVEVPDTEKNISQEHFPYVWITQLNRCFGNMQRYHNLPQNWKDTYERIINARNAILDYFVILLDAVEKFYRNENARVFSSDNYKKKKGIAYNLTIENPYIEPMCAVDRYGLRDDNYVVEDNHQKYSNEWNQESNKEHISYLCHEYFSHVHAFCESCENVLVDAKTKKQQGQKSRIAYYNLIQALMKIDAFQEKFDDYFSSFGIFTNSKRELDILEKTAAVFTIVFFNNYAREKSICYRAKESVRSTERKIVQFMKSGINMLPGVTRKIGEINQPVVDVEIFQFEKFLLQFYNSLKKLGKDMDNTSFSGYLLKKHFSKLHVNPICDGENTFPSIDIPVRNFLIYKEFDKFLSTVLPNDEKDNWEIINSSQAAIQGIGAISSLKILFVYASEIEHELLDKQESTIVKDVYCLYRRKVINLIVDAANILKSVAEYIFANAIINISEIKEANMALEEVADQLCDAIFDMAKELSYEEIANFFEELTTQFCKYVDASGVVIANGEIDNMYQ